MNAKPEMKARPKKPLAKGPAAPAPSATTNTSTVATAALLKKRQKSEEGKEGAAGAAAAAAAKPSKKKALPKRSAAAATTTTATPAVATTHIHEDTNALPAVHRGPGRRESIKALPALSKRKGLPTAAREHASHPSTTPQKGFPNGLAADSMPRNAPTAHAAAAGGGGGGVSSSLASSASPTGAGATRRKQNTNQANPTKLAPLPPSTGVPPAAPHAGHRPPPLPLSSNNTTLPAATASSHENNHNNSSSNNNNNNTSTSVTTATTTHAIAIPPVASPPAISSPRAAISDASNTSTQQTDHNTNNTNTNNHSSPSSHSQSNSHPHASSSRSSGGGGGGAAAALPPPTTSTATTTRQVKEGEEKREEKTMGAAVLPKEKEKPKPKVDARRDDDEEDEEEEDEEDEDEDEEEDESEEEDEDEEDEDEEDEDEEEEEEEEEPPSRKKKKQPRGSSKTATDKNLRLTTKVSREGDVNVKVVYIKPKMKFSAYVDELMLRFGFESPEDFDMYCVDASGDHVDIDVAADFVRLTTPYWERLQHGESGTGAKAAAKGGATGAAGATAKGGNKASAGEWSDDTVLRLYVRESFALRQRRAGSFRTVGQAAAGAPLSPDGQLPLRASVANWDALAATTSSSTATNLNLNAFNNFSSASPGNISLLFAETQNNLKNRTSSNFNKSVVLHANEELQWSRMNVIGKGSYGVVYEGITNDGKMLAVKVQEIPLEEEGAAEMKALEEEINLMSSLKHEHIVAYYGCQVKTCDNGSRQMEIFIELCHGGSLTQLRQKFVKANESFSISLVRSYTRQVLEGLRYLHASHVMHRDIKSDNVLISASGEAKLADFGCSKRITTANMPGNGAQGGYQTMVGSPFFMAPEVMNGSEAGYSYAADVWSVGCLVLELLGRQPWITPPGSNVFQIMFSISKATSMPTGVPKKCPPTLYNFFERVFERDPNKRATAAELLEHPWITCPDNELEEVPLDPEEAAAAAAAGR